MSPFLFLKFITRKGSKFKGNPGRDYRQEGRGQTLFGKTVDEGFFRQKTKGKYFFPKKKGASRSVSIFQILLTKIIFLVNIADSSTADWSRAVVCVLCSMKNEKFTRKG